MTASTAIIDCTSALIKLEPLLGMAVVLNVAYLGLSDFSFIEGVRNTVRHHLGAMDESVRKLLENTVWYRGLVELMRTQSLDEAPWQDQKFWIKGAPGLWGGTYNLVFQTRVGRILSVVFTSWSVAMLVLAVGQEIQVISWRNCTVDDKHISGPFIMAVTAMAWPLIVIAIGRLVTWRARAFVRFQIAGLKTNLDQEANAAVDTALAAQPRHLAR